VATALFATPVVPETLSKPWILIFLICGGFFTSNIRLTDFLNPTTLTLMFQVPVVTPNALIL
jgi:hypothetical protein